jgi:hypothetical protein
MLERSRRVTLLCLVQIRSASTSSQDRRDTTVETPGGDPTLRLERFLKRGLS